MANVLVIDDDQDITHFLQSQLGEEGHQVLVAHQGDEGLAKALKSAPDLIMLDVFLPDSTGYQICSQIRKNASTRSVPIIMMTGAARFPNQQQFGIERGANEYISKPFNVIEVDELIHKYIGANRVVRQEGSNTQYRTAPLMEAAPELKQPETSEDLAALSAFLEQSLAKKKAAAQAADYYSEPVAQNQPSEAIGNGVVKISFMVPPGSSRPHTPASPAPVFQPEPAPISEQLKYRHAVPAPQPVQEQVRWPDETTYVGAPPPAPEQPRRAQPIPAQPSADVFVASILASKERFVEFGIEIFALATRLSSTHAEKHLADQLLQSSLSIGAKLTESRMATSREEYMALLYGAQKDLRDTAYWLSLTHKIGLLKELGKLDLEKNCQSLTTLLNDFVNSQIKK